MYKLKLHRDVAKAFKKIKKSNRDDASKIEEAINSLADDPRPHGYTKLAQNLYRIKQGNYRVIYSVFEEFLIVTIVFFRRRGEGTYKELNSLIKKAERIIEQAAKK